MACQKIGYERVASIGIGTKNGGRWLWKSTPLLENGQLSNGKDTFLWQNSCNVWSILIIYPFTYHIHCSIIRMISTSHFPVLCGHFPSLPMCAYRISVSRPPPSSDTFGRRPKGVSHAFHWTCPGIDGDDRTFPWRISFFFAKKFLVLRETNG